MEHALMGVMMDILENSATYVCFFLFYFKTHFFNIQIIKIILTGFFMCTACANGYYGKNCSSVCSPNCKTCRHTDGQCDCLAGWNGFYCNTGNTIF